MAELAARYDVHPNDCQMEEDGSDGWLAGESRPARGFSGGRDQGAAGEDRPRQPRFFIQGLRSEPRPESRDGDPNARLSIVRQCRLVSVARSSCYYEGTGESPVNLA